VKELSEVGKRLKSGASHLNTLGSNRIGEASDVTSVVCLSDVCLTLSSAKEVHNNVSNIQIKIEKEAISKHHPPKKNRGK
jgi:hypothetical protein